MSEERVCKNCKFWVAGKLAGQCKFSDMQPDSFRFPSFAHYTTENHTCPVWKEKE